MINESGALIERLLKERLSLGGICRALGVGMKWLMGFLVECYQAAPGHLNVQSIRLPKTGSPALCVVLCEEGPAIYPLTFLFIRALVRQYLYLRAIFRLCRDDPSRFGNERKHHGRFHRKKRSRGRGNHQI
jgi:hypothetical protein